MKSPLFSQILGRIKCFIMLNRRLLWISVYIPKEDEKISCIVQDRDLL